MDDDFRIGFLFSDGAPDTFQISRIILTGPPPRAGARVRNPVDYAVPPAFAGGCGVFAGEFQRFAAQFDADGLGIAPE